MNRISPHGKPTTPRLRPVKMPPCKPNGRVIKSQVGGTNKEEANSDNRSTTGDPGLNENLGTIVTPDQRHVTAPPDTSTSPLKIRVPSRSGQKGSHRPATASVSKYFLTYRVSYRGNVADRGDRHRMVQT